MVDICPDCKSDLTGEPIPERHFLHNVPGNPYWNPYSDTSCEEQKKKYEGSCYCLPYGDKAPEDRFFNRLIGVEISEVYDGVLYWLCPDCGYAWHRWKDDTMRVIAQNYIDGVNSERNLNE